MNIWQDVQIRRSGRTTRMLCAAVATATVRKVVIVGADANHVDSLKRLYHEKCRQFSIEGWTPLGYVSSSTAGGWLGDGPRPQRVGGEPFFENSEALERHLRASATFVFVGERSGCHAWPDPPVIFVDDHARDRMIEDLLQRSGF
jgi:hypothetical protein